MLLLVKRLSFYIIGSLVSFLVLRLCTCMIAVLPGIGDDIPTFLTLLGLQSRFGDRPVKF